jgi:uncharacterized protein (TIGR02145 family)
MKRLFLAFAVITAITLSCKKDKKPDPTSPLVKTAAITNNGGGNITAGGSIVSDNGATVTKSGIAWSQGHATPTITDSIVEATATTGAFTININGIDFGKTYYFRAFATNSAGTGYGDVVTLTTSSDSVRFTYNGQTVTYGIITSSASGKKWLDRNLGAKRVATAYDDYQAYGDLFQWGRPADGHQLINWTASNAGTPVNGTTSTLSATDVPGHSNFITPAYIYPTSIAGDWRSDNNSNRWATIPKGPCPIGWHVPTIDEWKAEASTSGGGTATSGGIVDGSTGFNLLKLTIAGLRKFNGNMGTFGSAPGDFGFYWSSTDYNNSSEGFTQARDFEVGSPAVGGGSQTFIDYKGAARSVRCIKD